MSNEKVSLSSWIDLNFGNKDGKFDIKDVFRDAPSIALVVADFVMLFAEYRVFMVGMALTKNDPILATGFLLVSSIPFYLGQIAFVYNSANQRQQLIAVLLILMGLGASGYYGLADFLYASGANISSENAFSVAIYLTIALILLGLLYALVDDKIATKRHMSKLESQAAQKEREMEMREQLLVRSDSLLEAENKLRERFGSAAVDGINTSSFSMASDTEEQTLEEETSKN